MKNKLYTLLILVIGILFSFKSHSAEDFNFNITEVEILENGNIFKGTKKGTVNTNDGIKITADNFVYDKTLNVLNANGNVEIEDINRNVKIFSNSAIYKKNLEILTTYDNSKAIYNNNLIIFGNTFKFDRNQNTMNAKGDVKIEDTVENNLIFADDVTYYRNLSKISSKGDTKAFIQSKYDIISSDVTYSIDTKTLSSQYKTRIEDQNSQVYFIEEFKYSILDKILKGEEILIITNYNLPKSDKIFLENAIINLNDQKFLAKNTEVKVHKNIFDISENDPRIKGVSSKGEKNITTINKGIFTSCKKNDNCPPWSISAQKIEHNKTKKQLLYDNAVLKIYDLPVFYFPKFFHPDPSVERQSGILKQEINSSNVLGSSLTIPYFKVISKDKDLTLTPTWFDTKTSMISAEYRHANKSSNLLVNSGFVDGYKSPTTKKKNSLSHLFVRFKSDLNLDNYISSKIDIMFEKVSNDTYLNVFDQHITKSKARPKNFNKLNNHIKLFLDHEKFNFDTGVQSYENLKIKNNNDRYTYNLPYYNFSKNIEQDLVNGNVGFSSSGSNILNNTNTLNTNIINNFNYNSIDVISIFGFKTNYGINIKNLNSVGKQSSKYKSSTQAEILSIYNMDTSYPLIKNTKNSKNQLTPKLSFRFNPSDMKNYSSSSRVINADNAFSINRLGLSDSFESGRSLTLGLDYKKENNNLNNINNYFEAKLATVLRDKEEKFIPKKSSLNKTNSNLFGSITNNFSDKLKIGYNFSLDNDYNTLEYNDINTTFSINNIVTNFIFIEENGERGDKNILATEIDYNLNGKNSLQFKTRRNRKINFTEYYDLVYEYKNDCLTAGIKYKKTYYSDGDLKPKENLFFTVTLFPLTTFEQDAKDLLDN